MKCDFLSPTIQRCRDSSHESGERSVRGIGDQSHDRNTSSKYLSSLCVVTRGIMNDTRDDHGTQCKGWMNAGIRQWLRPGTGLCGLWCVVTLLISDT